jgi:transposase
MESKEVVTLRWMRTWTERHAAIASRAVPTERARQWAFEQVGDHDATVSAVGRWARGAWWTVMDQAIERGTPAVADPARLDPLPEVLVTAVGVDETAFLRATGTRPTPFPTGITVLDDERAGFGRPTRPGDGCSYGRTAGDRTRTRTRTR